MSVRTFSWAIILSYCLILPTTAVAGEGNWYLGAGLDTVSLEVENLEFDDSLGFLLNFGYRFSSLLALDFIWGGSSHEDPLGGDLGYGLFGVGPKLILPTSGAIQPYVTAGLLFNALDFDLFENVDGGGLYLGMGVDFFIDKRSAIGAGIRTARWTGEDSFYDYDCETTILSLVYTYHLLQ